MPAEQTQNLSCQYHQSLQLKEFTAFHDTELNFVPGINVFVGENGTGKTHIMKALYGVQRAGARQVRSISETFRPLFQIHALSELVRLGDNSATWTVVRGFYGGQEWLIDFQRHQSGSTETRLDMALRPVFIPAIDMIAHTKGFLQAASEVVLDFDLTCTDIVTLLGLERKNGKHPSIELTGITSQLGGELVYEEQAGRFYLQKTEGRLPIPLVAEGVRKIATLLRLVQNGWIVPGTTLFWDEPEANLNPKLMDELVGAILTIARAGVQIFIATHSYVILKELDLQTSASDSIQYFGFRKGDEGTTVSATDKFALLDPNPILEQYDSLYDRELTRTTGRNRKGERISREQY